VWEDCLNPKELDFWECFHSNTPWLARKSSHFLNNNEKRRSKHFSWPLKPIFLVRYFWSSSILCPVSAVPRSPLCLLLLVRNFLLLVPLLELFESFELHFFFFYIDIAVFANIWFTIIFKIFILFIVVCFLGQTFLVWANNGLQNIGKYFH